MRDFKIKFKKKRRMREKNLVTGNLTYGEGVCKKKFYDAFSGSGDALLTLKMTRMTFLKAIINVFNNNNV